MTRPLTVLLVTLLLVSILIPRQPTGAEQKWVEVRSPNFIVVSNAGEKEARKTAVHFEQIRAVFRRSLAVAGQHPSPLITIVAAKDEGTMKSLLPEYWAKNHMHPAGIFLERDNMLFAAVQLNTEGANPYHTIFHEYYHSLTLPYYPNLPLWVAEGLADFWGNTDVNSSDVQMGKPDENLVLELRQSSLIPLDVLFKVDHSSPYYNEQEKTSIFYAESWALTHYLMIGDKASHRAMLSAYLDAISQGATPEEAAAKGFGDLKRLQSTLESYIRSNSFYILKGSAPPEIPQSDLKVRELSESEIDAYRGGFETIRGNGKDAIPILEQAVKADPKLALGYQYLGYAEFQTGKHQEALADFSRAIELDPNNAITRFMRARMYAMSGGDQDKIKEDLRVAISADPNFAPAYGILAVYMAGNRENLPEALTLAKKATNLQPGNSTYQFDMAQVLLAMNRIADARMVGLAARKNAIYPEQRMQAEQFLKNLEGVADSSTSPATH
jgi:tetratricopeptide (TPR) repeat protein